MPVASPPGPSTWLFGQAYGNTPGAYNFGDAWYRAGQGLHFGIDVSMPCGTPLVAVADGVIAFVDDLGFGAGHNLIVRHDQLGVTTLYGHLQGRAPVSPGQQVVQGEQIGVSGDPDSTCFSRPHLHFEVRSLDYQTTFNPIDWIDVDWHTLALVGAYSGNLFQGDMENPGRWMSLDDQPDVRFYGPRLNAYRSVFPRTGADNAPNSAGPLERSASAVSGRAVVSAHNWQRAVLLAELVASDRRGRPLLHRRAVRSAGTGDAVGSGGAQSEPNGRTRAARASLAGLDVAWPRRGAGRRAVRFRRARVPLQHGWGAASLQRRQQPAVVGEHAPNRPR
ncbi:MAG: M23 family metallopeptidase [Chloroflexi bacterium]|nr:M23 family metallopeptidase [Chloroflexota bacterium]